MEKFEEPPNIQARRSTAASLSIERFEVSRMRLRRTGAFISDNH
jgi:hypothetical protein